MMNGVFVDSCVLLDLFTDDKNWGEWSENILEKYSQTNTLYINSIVYTEVSIGFKKIEELEGWGRLSVENLRYAINEKKKISL